MEKGRSRRQKKSNIILVLSLIIIIILGISGYKIYKKTRFNSKQQKTMLKELALMEGRFNKIGPFIELLSWFQVMQKTQDYYYTYHDVYLDLDEITSEIISSSDPSQVVKGIRTVFWNNGILFDSFVPVDSLKNRLYTIFGKYHLDFLNWPEKNGYLLEFELSSNKKQYKVTINEAIDHTMDNDAADYWIFDSKSGEIRFKDNYNQMSVIDRLKQYLETMPYENP